MWGWPKCGCFDLLSWCREAVEAVAWVHTKGVFHCDINPTNLLLDSEFHVKLADFQGQQISPVGSGTVLLDDYSSESTRFFCGREDEFNGDVRTELFALGCTIYHIIMGHPVYPDTVDGEDGWHEKVESRFRDKCFPSDLPIHSEID
ncbi:3-phosphoinositide-dependent protein kinase 1 [Colletotrichum shisoi]|uniref:3-phosphoinositide-dependent protein kinase 1 n=1 Tax=Colletotrichum shisoi TaxID=2078593 RepID=A0A5Q4BBM0_9PEZI|nr:3-phosphoinositide-dependent protein kinase 1 [Colletotrichum shisoi]